MTSKERAELRGQANGMQPLFQVGKGGISDALIKQTDDALTARELIKIKVLLETAPEKPKEIAQKLAEATNSECVGVIGGSMIFYRYNPELHKDEKKKAKHGKGVSEDDSHHDPPAAPQDELTDERVLELFKKAAEEIRRKCK